MSRCHIYTQEKNTKNVNFAYGWSTRDVIYIIPALWLPSVFCSHTYILFIFFCVLASQLFCWSVSWLNIDFFFFIFSPFFISSYGKQMFKFFNLFQYKKKYENVEKYLNIYIKMSSYHASWSPPNHHAIFCSWDLILIFR